MAPQVLSFFILLSTLLYMVSAQLGPNHDWINPDSTKDFTSIFARSGSVTIAWNAALNNSKSDLYLTSFDEVGNPYYSSSPLANSVNISVAGSLTCIIDVPANIVQKDNRFVFRFIPAGQKYIPHVYGFVQSPSPGFNLTDNQATSTTTGTDTSTSTNASSPNKTNNSDPSQSSTSNSPQGLPPTAQIGIGVGVGGGVFVIILFVAGCIFGRRLGMKRRSYKDEYGGERGFTHKGGSPMTQSTPGSFRERKRAQTLSSSGQPNSGTSEAPTEDNRTWYTSRRPWAEVIGSHLHPIEKDSDRSSMSESDIDQSPPIEKSLIRVRGGMHELA